VIALVVSRCQPARLLSRPVTTVSVLGLAAHVFYEIGCGVGMPLASLLGVRPAAAGWAAATVGGLRATRQRGRGADVAFVVFNGAALAVAVGHLGGWPKAAGRRLPWLVSCEGLSGPAMPTYNTILYLSAASAAAALLTENGLAARRWAALPLLGSRAAARMQHREHERLVALAAEHPRWAYRRLRDPAAPPDTSAAGSHGGGI
jgi:hypothetical protein